MTESRTEAGRELVAHHAAGLVEGWDVATVTEYVKRIEAEAAGQTAALREARDVSLPIAEQLFAVHPDNEYFRGYVDALRRVVGEDDAAPPPAPAADLDVARLIEAAFTTYGDAYSRDEWEQIAAEYRRLAAEPKP